MPSYQPKYEKSWALIIGINQYQQCAPLVFARQDAEAVAKTLEQHCGFESDRISVLTDADATGEAIRRAYMSYVSAAVSEDDRIVVFFAGHGHTRSGGRGEVGFLVPVDGDLNDLATLIRWDELTRNASLIPAKHILFIMDACYGGLAVARTLPPGSSRFLGDMLVRYARQVLTAGKANEVVADSSGPRPGHSVFTGHLLDAIEGAATTSDGILSTNAVIGYVYDRVAKDHYSQQTPHYGYIDGDGDLILSGVPPLVVDNTDGFVTDVVIHTLASSIAPPIKEGDQSGAGRVKRLLSDAAGRIQLDDTVAAEIRAALELSEDRQFPANTPFSKEEFQSRLSRYEAAISGLVAPLILIARWGDLQHQLMLQKGLSRLADGIEQQGGLAVWLGLRWYPIEFLMYSAGIAAIACDNFSALSRLFFAPVGHRMTGSSASEAAIRVVDGMSSGNSNELFKQLPNFERHYTPKSDYLFTRLQPQLEDLLFLGREYEDHFDGFEIMYALVHADISQSRGGVLWGPVGRFGWKGRRGGGQKPFDIFVERAMAMGDNWPGTQAGLFGGSPARFKEVVTQFRDEIMTKIRWF